MWRESQDSVMVICENRIQQKHQERIATYILTVMDSHPMDLKWELCIYCYKGLAASRPLVGLQQEQL